MTLQGSNTYLVGKGRERILIDTGVGKEEWIKTLEKVLADEGVSIKAALITHWHHDHIGGISDLLSKWPGTAVYKNNEDVIDKEVENIVDGQEFKVDGATLRAVHSPGHTQDHMSFYFLEENAMFTGDNVLGHGTTVFENLKQYLESLKKLATFKSKKGYPGHGEVLEDLPSTIEMYIEHRHARELQLIGYLREAGMAGLKITEIVEKIYEGIPESVIPVATRGVYQILEKLEEEGRVKEAGDHWILLDTNPKSTL